MDQPIFILQSIPPSGHVAEPDCFFAGNLLSPLTAQRKMKMRKIFFPLFPRLCKKWWNAETRGHERRLQRNYSSSFLENFKGQVVKTINDLEYNINLVKNIFNYSRRVLYWALAMLKFQSQESRYSRCLKISSIGLLYKSCREGTLHYSVLALSRRLTVVAAELYQGCAKAL